MIIKKNTFMGRMREEIKKETTEHLAENYKSYNAEGKKAAYDELRSRGFVKAANYQRYGVYKKPTTKQTSSPQQWGFKIPKSSIGRVRFKFY